MDSTTLNLVLKQIEENTRSKFKIRETLQQFNIDCQDRGNHNSDPTLDDIYGIVESVKHSDNAVNFVSADIGILKKILLWQYAFYCLSDKPDIAVKNLYMDLYFDWDIMNQNIANELANITDCLRIPFNFDMSVPLVDALESVETLAKSMRITIKSVYSIVKDKIMRDVEARGIIPFIVFQHEVAGNEAIWEETVNGWGLCHHMYKEHYVNGVTKAEIVRDWDKSKVNLVVRDMPNSISRLNKMLAKAKRLIASSENGTFPC